MSSPDEPGVVVLHWTMAAKGLVESLASTVAEAGVRQITCVGEREAELRALEALDYPVRLRGVVVDRRSTLDELVERFDRDVRVAAARAVIVLPPAGIDDPDSTSRLACAAIRRACGDRVGPNVLVEIEDPEAAFEFVGLGVATVFYPGHLRAALLGQACVDLGVFQFVVGLLRGRHRVRTIEVPAQLRDKNFADAALALEEDERGRPMTVIGVARETRGQEDERAVVVNPGPATPLRDVLGLLALVSDGAVPSAAEERQRQ
ncbi:hypothetical protein G6O69_21285 [Pseudenhygromyxa sp. WMMC2535]|uniref:hypothetical protein n=1 Tax=Pseudenhygromyxa sp. WMMC2535 TaxID=2712867 RepID=UPI0015575191|nr:hypothetical protein [Pseudenhygromyxa sp. WMMC2535]NVB40387.1 hypothetical protein [Pseudenhygromyxa sp. WMMC2535]